jgi:hypothetical protein
MLLTAVAACTGAGRFGAAPPQSPAALRPPPVNLGGGWRRQRVAAAGGAGAMTLGDPPGAAEGSVARAVRCPGNFFASRKWTFEHTMLIIRDGKGAQLAQLSYAGGHFEGQYTKGATLSLSR